LVFLPNKIFSDYISQVLPDLGEENVPQLTYREFAESFFDWQWDVETHVAYLEELLSQDEDERQRRLERCSFKSSPAFQRVLDALIQLVTGEAAAFSDIYMGKKLLMSAAEQERLFGESYAYLPVQKRLLKIRQRILHVLRPLKKRRLRAVLNAIQQEAAFEGETWLDRKSTRLNCHVKISYADY